MKASIGVVHGRFQLFHNDHLKYVLAARERCERLIIGICNPDAALTAYSAANPHRSAARENPFTYFERYEMIRGTLLAQGIPAEQFDIVPFPINYPERIPAYVPMSAQFYTTVYDDWGREKIEKLQGIGCEVEVLRDVDISQKGISGSDVRELIRTGGEWASYVPAYVYEYMTAHGLDKRLIDG